MPRKTHNAKTKKARIKWHMVSHRGAVVVFYQPTKDPETDLERGWYVREYHSDYVMRAHLRHILTGAPPPKHLSEQKGWDWCMCYSDNGPCTESEAMGLALDLAYVPWQDVPGLLEERAMEEKLQ